MRSNLSWKLPSGIEGSSSAADVVGPASSTDNAIVRFDGTTGKEIQNSTWILSDLGSLTVSNGVVSQWDFSGLGGAISITTGSGLLYIGGETGSGASRILEIKTALNGTASLNFGELSTISSQYSNNYTFDQASLLIGNIAGRQLVIGDYVDGAGKDFDHAIQTNPTIFLHSATDPDVANDEWVSFSHDVTDAVIETGSGDLILSPFTSQVIFDVGNASSPPIAFSSNKDTGIYSAATENVSVACGGVQSMYCDEDHNKLLRRFELKIATSSVSATTLILPTDGAIYPVTSNTTVDYIDTTNFNAGAVVIIWVVDGFNFTNNAGGGALGSILLNSGSFSGWINSTLTLFFNGTQWMEIGRKQ